MAENPDTESGFFRFHESFCGSYHKLAEFLVEKYGVEKANQLLGMLAKHFQSIMDNHEMMADFLYSQGNAVEVKPDRAMDHAGATPDEMEAAARVAGPPAKKKSPIDELFDNYNWQSGS